MRPDEIRIDINDIAKGTKIGELRLRGLRRFHFRLWICSLLIRLAAWAAPGRVDVETDR